ncbi:hypothetical protein CR513_16198, partial [Mucuna pruriens]
CFLLAHVQTPLFTAFQSETEIVHLCSVCPHPAETKPNYLYRDHLGSVFVESDLAIAECRPKCMTRSRSSNSLHSFDPKIDKTLNRIRKTKNIHVGHSRSSFNSISESDTSEYKLDIIDNPLYELEPMENNNKILKELVIPDVLHQPWCIQYPQLELAQSYELKFELIHLLPKFHGLVGEDPHKHLKEFHVVYSTMRPQGIPKDYIKMKAFLFSLDGTTKIWLYLQPIMFNTWGDMKCMFLEKFFPTSRTTTILKEICGIRQHFEETLHEYWERFNKLCATCPHYQISLLMMDRNKVDAKSGGALMDKTPAFETRGGAVTSRVVSKVGAFDNLRLENQLIELISLVSDKAPRCRAASTKHMHMWNLHLDGAPYKHGPTFCNGRLDETNGRSRHCDTTSGRELSQQATPQPNLRPAKVETEQGADSRVQQPARGVPLPFPT